MNTKNKQGHSINFAISVALTLCVLFVLYLIFKDKYLVDVSGKATYITGIFGTAVGLAGAWVAIRIAEIATSAQEQANKFDNPYYQKANVIITAARDFMASFESLVSSAERTRDYSFAEGRPNLAMLSWACKTASQNLQYQLMGSGLYAVLVQIEKVHNERSSVYSIVQNLLALIEDLSNLEKTTDLQNAEAELIMSKYVIAMLNLDYLAKLVKEVPNIEILSSLLETGDQYKKPPENSTDQTCGIKTSHSIINECKARNDETIDQISLNRNLTATECEDLLQEYKKEILIAWFERSLVSKESHPVLSESIPDLNQYSEETKIVCQKVLPHMNKAMIEDLRNSKLGLPADEDQEEIENGTDEEQQPTATKKSPAKEYTPGLYRTALIDFGTFRTKDLFQTLCDNLSRLIGPQPVGPIVIRSFTDLLPHVKKEHAFNIEYVHDRCRVIKGKHRELYEISAELNKLRRKIREIKQKQRTIQNKQELKDLIYEKLHSSRLTRQTIVRFSKKQEEITNLHMEVFDYLQRISSGLVNPNQKLFVIELSSDHDFMAKLQLSNYLPFALLHWRGYPYLPSPGFLPREFFDHGLLKNSQIAITSVFPEFTCLTPLIASGALFVVPDPVYNKVTDPAGYAHIFESCRRTPVLEGML